MKKEADSPTLLKSQVKRTLRTLGVRPRKRWSQCFLVDAQVRDAIVSAAGVQKGETVLEIGAGTGVVTERLVDVGAQVVAVEKDRAFARHLRKRFGNGPGVRVVEADFLKCDLDKMDLPEKVRVVGNLPYHITSPILFHLVKYRSRFSGLWLTLQREVAGRILASPGRKEYGVLTLSLGLWFRSRLVFLVSHSAFYPVPQVESALIEFEVHDEPPARVPDTDFFMKVVRTAYQQRRKRIDNSLLPLLGPGAKKEEIRKLIQQIGLDAGLRAERLTLEDYANLSIQLQPHTQQPTI